MAKTGKCSACGYEPVATDARTCPKCGKKDPNPGSIPWLLIWVALFLGAIGLAMYLNSL